MNRTHIVVQPTSNGLSMLSDAQPENMARNFAKSFHGSLVLPIDDPKQFTVFTNGNAELKPDIRFMNEQATTDFALALRSWRKRERISQREAALRLNRPYSTYRQWEYGLRVPHGAELYLKIINAPDGKP